jgi:hypothetical protein
MIQLLIVAAILGIIYFTFLGGNTKKIEEKPVAPYQQEIQRVQGLEQSIQQAADQRKRDIDQQISQD